MSFIRVIFFLGISLLCSFSASAEKVLCPLVHIDPKPEPA